MITQILRLIESAYPPSKIQNPKSNIQHRLQPATIYALPATASAPLILRLKNLMLKTRSFHPQNESQSRFAWQSEFLFIQEKSKLTLAPQREVRLPNRAFSSVGYDTMTSMYDTPVRCPASREPSRFSSI
jgi:hypothetical protein